MRQILRFLVLPVCFAFMSVSAFSHETGDDYPTLAIADYIFGCMIANGQTRTVLEKCSCSIDVISSILPYDEYVEAEAVMGISLLGGEKTTIFRTSPLTVEIVNKLKRAQLEGELRCF